MAVKTFLQDLSDPDAVTRSIEENTWQYFASWFRSDTLQSRISHHESHEVSWTLSHEPAALFNPIWGADFSSNSKQERVAEIVGLCKLRQTPFSWTIGPSSASEETDNLLKSMGLHRAEPCPSMALDLSTLPDALSLPTGVKITRVTNHFDLVRMTETICQGFGIPTRYYGTVRKMWQHSLAPGNTHIRHYLATIDGEIVAASTAILGESSVGLYNICTLPDYQHRGIGTAMTIAPLLEARKDGYKVGTLQATPAGYSLYERIGFRHYCDIATYHWSPPTYIN